MTTSVFAFLSIRLFAIFLVVEGLLDLGQVTIMWSMIGPEGERLVRASALLLPLIPPIAGIAIWFAAAPLARAAQLPGSDSSENMAIGAELWTRLVIVLFGLYLIATSIPSLAAIGVRSFEQTAAMPGASIGELMFRDSSMSYELTYASVRLVIGLVLIIGRAGVFTFVTFLRTFGLGGKGPSNQSVQSDGQETGRR